MLKFTNDKFIKRSDLIPGQIYLWKDGHLRWFLGQLATTGELCFYTLARACLLDNHHDVTFTHERCQLPFLQNYMVALIANASYDADAFEQYNTMPSIYGVFPCDVSAQLQSWLRKHRITGITCTSKIATGSEYVSAKDLEVGALYFSGQSPWRSTYCYMGRNSRKEFVWLFIGNDEVFKKDPIKYINTPASCDLERTKSNKKVRRLTKEWHSLLGDFKVNWSPEVLSMYVR